MQQVSLVSRIGWNWAPRQPWWSCRCQTRSLLSGLSRRRAPVGTMDSRHFSALQQGCTSASPSRHASGFSELAGMSCSSSLSESREEPEILRCSNPQIVPKALTSDSNRPASVLPPCQTDRGLGRVGPAQATGVDPNVCTGDGLIEQEFDMRQLGLFATTHEALMQAMQCPHVTRMLARTRESSVKTKIRTINGFSLVMGAGLQQERAKRVPRRLRPRPGFLVFEAVVQFDSPA